MEFLLSGLIGALAVFFFGWLREWWRNEQERRGVLILLQAEIKHNAEVIGTVFDRVGPERAMEDLIGHPNFPKLKTRTWSNVQGRAAALLPDDFMATLDGYYSPLETLLTFAGFANMVRDSFDRTLRRQIQEMKPDWSVAATRNPYREQLDKLLDAQEPVLAKIEEHTLRDPGGGLCSCRLIDGYSAGDKGKRPLGRGPEPHDKGPRPSA